MIALLFCLCGLMGISHIARAATASNGRIYGQLLDGSKKSVPVVGQSVTLQMAQGNISKDLLSVRTDAKGNFSFSGLNTDNAINYSVYTLYQRAQYNTKLLDLSAHAQQQANLTVYDATNSDTKIAVLDATILLKEPDARTGVVSVSELYVFNNLDDHTYVGSLDTSKGMPNALRFALPHTSRNISLGAGFAGYQTIQVNNGFASSAAVPPGVTQFSFTFDMPYSQSSYDFDYVVNYPTVQMSLYVPPDIHANSDTLSSRGIVTADQHPYQLLQAATLRPGLGVHAQLEGLPTMQPAANASAPGSNNALWLLVIIVAMVMIVLITLSPYLRYRRGAATAKNSSKPAPAKSVSGGKSEKATTVASISAEKTEQELSVQREVLLQRLLDLDTAYEAGKLPKKVYQERRAKTKAKLRALMANENQPVKK